MRFSAYKFTNSEIINEVKEAREEYNSGKLKEQTVEEIMDNILND